MGLSIVFLFGFFTIPGVFLQDRNNSLSAGVTCECGWKNVNTNKDSVNIIGGDVVNDFEYPYIAGVIPADSSCWDVTCGATILGAWHVITAAHCIQPDEKYAVVAGLSHLENCNRDTTQIRPVSEQTLHPKYNAQTLENDIALLTLSSSLKFTPNIGPACLPSATTIRPFSETDQLIVMGWGLTESEEEGSDVLREVSLSGMKFSECAEMYKGSEHTPKSPELQFCLIQSSCHPQGVCRGDSGGPALILDPASKLYFQEGILSFGPSNCTTRAPSVYTRLTPYVSWLQHAANLWLDYYDIIWAYMTRRLQNTLESLTEMVPNAAGRSHKFCLVNPIMYA